MTENHPRHRPDPPETVPERSATPSESVGDVSREVEQAEHNMKRGSLHTEFEQLGEAIDALRIEGSRSADWTDDRQRELDDLKQQYQLAMDELHQFKSETAGEWDSFRARMEKRHEHLQERLDEFRPQLPE